MADVPRNTQPGDMVSGGNVYRHAQRDPEVSSLGAIGRIMDKLGFGDDRRRSRLAAGFASQWYGLDDAGNPAFGETPGIISETKALGAIPSMLIQPLTDKMLGMMGADPDDAYVKIMKKVGMFPGYNAPKWATDASDHADAIHNAVREDMGLAAPKGFEQNAQESAGVMLGQLPIPGKMATKAAEELGSVGALAKTLGPAAEWFTPTVEPGIANYASGALFGGAMGTLGDSAGSGGEQLPTVVQGNQPGLYDVRPTYSDGSIGYSGSPEDLKALQDTQAAERVSDPNYYAHRTNFYGGGSVNKIDKCDGGMAEVRALGRKYAAGGKVKNLRRATLDAVLSAQKRGKGPHEWHVTGPGNEEEIIKDVPGSQAWDVMQKIKSKYGKFTRFDSHWGDSGALRTPSGAVGVGLDPDKAKEVRAAALERPLHNRPFRLKNSKTGQEWGGRYTSRAEAEAELQAHRKDGTKGTEDMRIVMMDLPTIERTKKYAEGGRVSALKAIKDAIAHLDNGDTVSALRTLHSSPGALADPNIAAAVAKLRHPTTARAGRQVLDANVEAAANTRLPAFAKGGKMSRVDKFVKKTKKLTTKE